MVPIAWRNLFQDKLRLAISVGGVALSIMLVLLLGGFLPGINRQITAYIDNTPADFYVSQKGVANFQGAGSIIPYPALWKIEALEGVISAVPVFAQYAILELHNRKVTTFLLGYEPARGGGPWRLSEGRAVENGDETVVDRVFADRHGLRLGDELDILGKRFRIVGLSDETAAWMVSLIFLRHDTATALLRAQGTTSFILIDSAEASTVAQRLKETFPDLNVVSREAVASNDVKLFAGVFAAPLRMMVAIAIGIGALLVGLTIYSSTVERVREYGVLKAIGMRNKLLYRVVVQQAAGATALGFIVGLVMVWLVAGGIQRIWPQFLIVIDGSSVLEAAAGALAMALLASLLPARYLGNIDPASIFRR